MQKYLDRLLCGIRADYVGVHTIFQRTRTLRLLTTQWRMMVHPFQGKYGDQISLDVITKRTATVRELNTHLQKVLDVDGPELARRVETLFRESSSFQRCATAANAWHAHLLHRSSHKFEVRGTWHELSASNSSRLTVIAA